MSAEWGRIEEIFRAAITLPGEERAAFVTQVCDGDEQLAREVTEFLHSHDEANEFLERPAIELHAAAFADEAEESETLQAGTSLGEYRIVSLLGLGGMGEVYLAEDTGLGRQVAIKLVRRGFGSAGSVRHLRREARILAALNDPHIARLYGVAVTPEGVPYFVMEYVAGERIDHYCRKHHLTTNEILVLFRKVCSAVSFAHRHLIIHRDIKPANIRLTPEGEPKLLDFGIAKLLDPETTRTSEQTITLNGVMTPDYASPEQVRGESMTTGSDVYSLGVVLHELLTGARPFSLTNRKAREISHTLSERELVRPGARRPRLAADLEKIVSMALREEPERRYLSVGQFAEDIRRYLAGLPVSARKETWLYRGSKFARRHRLGLATAALLLLTLLAGIVTTTWEARRANRRFEDVRQLAHSFLFEIEPQIADLPGATVARGTLVRRGLQYLDRLSQEAAGQHDLQAELAAAYEKVGDVQGEPNQANLGNMAGAVVSYCKARALRETLLRRDPHSATLRNDLAHNYEQSANLFWWSNQTENAVACFEKALALRSALVAEQPSSATFRRALADLEMRYGDIPEWNDDARGAQGHFQKALVILRDLAARSPNDNDIRAALGRCLTRIGSAQKIAGDFEGAEATFAEAFPILQTLADGENAYGFQHDFWILRFRQCELFLEKLEGRKALDLCPAIIQLAQSLHEKDPNDAMMLHNLAASHSYAGEAHLLVHEYAPAITEFREAMNLDTPLAARSPGSGEYSRSRAVDLLGIGKAQLALAQPAAALETQKQARAMLEKVVATDRENSIPRSDLAMVLQQVGEIHARQEDHAEARVWFQRALKTVEDTPSAARTRPDQKLLAALRHEIAQ